MFKHSLATVSLARGGIFVAGGAVVLGDQQQSGRVREEALKP